MLKRELIVAIAEKLSRYDIHGEIISDIIHLVEQAKLGGRAELVKAAMQGILSNSGITLAPAIVANSAELYADETLKKMEE